jgi:CheY-like chemotaxis protein
MDHMMPEMDGVETTHAIRELGGKYRSLPIIALTANAVHGAKEMFLANGFNEFISKPIDMYELNKVLLDLLPREKITELAETEELTDRAELPKSGALELISNISEINTEIGISHVSGVESMYLESMELFSKKLQPEYENMSNYLNGNDLKAFSISVHAMKSMLATIGAINLSKTALNLETASKGMDEQTCIEQFPAFKEKLLALHEQLSAIFPSDEEANKKEPGDIGHLKENVEKAIAAADDYDSETGIAAINDLLAFYFGENNNTMLTNAKTAFLDYQYDEAQEILEKISC